MKKKTILAIILIGVLVIAGTVVLGVTGTKNAQAAFLEKYGLSGLDTKSIVRELDSRIDEPKELVSSITGESLTLRDGTSTVELDLPKDSFYLAFAPYENSTHPCGFHSPSSCRGELVNVLVHATITDEKGAVILDEDLETMDNGFVGVWLPKNINATIQVAYDGKVATAPISTFAASETCLTTPLKLN
ncbi:MAG: CueP family metal-binding protein [Anaerolineaceae bacterium]|nr:CueP family metal-binding protein [Anaerolineaceae bacterium]